MKKTNPSKSEQLWRERIASADAFDGTAVAYCRANDIDVNCFYSWRKRLKFRIGISTRSPFVPAIIDVPPVEHNNPAQLPDAQWIAEVLAHLVRRLV
jgi:hypothetical protein